MSGDPTARASAGGSGRRLSAAGSGTDRPTASVRPAPIRPSVGGCSPLVATPSGGANTSGGSGADDGAASSTPSAATAVEPSPAAGSKSAAPVSRQASRTGWSDRTSAPQPLRARSRAGRGPNSPNLCPSAFDRSQPTVGRKVFGRKRINIVGGWRLNWLRKQAARP